MANKDGTMADTQPPVRKQWLLLLVVILITMVLVLFLLGDY